MHSGARVDPNYAAALLSALSRVIFQANKYLPNFLFFHSPFLVFNPSKHTINLYTVQNFYGTDIGAIGDRS